VWLYSNLWDTLQDYTQAHWDICQEYLEENHGDKFQQFVAIPEYTNRARLTEGFNANSAAKSRTIVYDKVVEDLANSPDLQDPNSTIYCININMNNGFNFWSTSQEWGSARRVLENHTKLSRIFFRVWGHLDETKINSSLVAVALGL
jgi:hypothetical protein